ncbi:dual OB domain-containing protein [Aliivibrio fischeri]|uniref:Dual OB-containing domain-containing protein n=1 Tax=Aliivibrio fischeri TaxID=668 RepID=A0A844P8D5_ALIFS|nr:hypothetical protein [Aliivibrio fischeri]MUK51498.1 hypothetical protein [Aliivibrio fischeri]
MILKNVVVLANSVKHQQHCVAGKCVSTKMWVRPVSNAEGAELSTLQAKYQNPHGEFLVKPKQKIRMNFRSAVPLLHQPENFLISGNKWIQNYFITDDELENYLDEPENLWGTEDRVNYDCINSERIVISQSLYLVSVDDLRLYKNDTRRSASFTYNEIEYDLAVTDPKFDGIYQEHEKGTGIICVSLGEVFQGFCYKLVATIF